MASIGKRKPFKLVDETPVLVNGNQEARETTILRSWADVKLKNSFRDVQHNQTSLAKFFEFRFRYRGDISVNVNVKLVYNGSRYAIQSIERENEKKLYWIIRVEAKTFN